MQTRGVRLADVLDAKSDYYGCARCHLKVAAVIKIACPSTSIPASRRYELGWRSTIRIIVFLPH